MKKKIALLASEPLVERVAGIGLRYLELARRLPAHGVEVVAVSPADPADVPLPEGAARRFVAGRLREIVGDCDGAVAQGQLANDLLLECPDLPVAIDLYDPWLIENLHYAPELGHGPYRNDHATWVLQLSRGDFFLCSSEEQRLYYLGFLTALGRINPRRLEIDPDAGGLIAAVPFGVPEELPPHRPLLDPPRPGEKRILFGALYDWYDPWVLLDALERLDAASPDSAEEAPWTLLFVRHPNPDGTPQRLLREVEARCRARGWWGSRVRTIDWVPQDRRYDLLRDVDVLAAPHHPSLETRLAMRTRFLDALAAGCPVVTCEGGTLSRLLTEAGAGWVVPTGDPDALAGALREALGLGDAEAGEAARGRHVDRVDRVDRSRGAAELARRFAWNRVIEPLAAFCRDPRVDPTKEGFAFRPATFAAPDPLPLRLRHGILRRLRRLLSAKPEGGAA